MAHPLMQSFMIDNDLQATISRALTTPLALSHTHPTQRCLSLVALDDQLFVSDGKSTEIHPIMSTTNDSLHPDSPVSVMSYRRPSVQSNMSSVLCAPDGFMSKADIHLEVEKAVAKLELARKQAVVYDTFESLEEKLHVLNVLLKEIASEADGLKAKRTETQKEHDALEVKLRNAEGDKQNFVLAVQMDKGEKDKVMLRKAELNVMKLRAGLVEKEIEIMEIDMQISDDQAKKANSNTKITDAQGDLDATQKRFDELKLDLDVAEADFEAKFGRVLGSLPSPNATGSAQDLAKENEALKEKVETMLPVYNAGHVTRLRYLAGELRQLKNKPIEKEIDNKSQDAWRLGMVVADAAMFLETADKPRISAEEFELIYGVTPAFAWQNREFQKLMNLLGWKADVRKAKNYFKGDAFTNAYERLMQRIMPTGPDDLEIINDEELDRGEYTTELYMTCQAEHSKARVSMMYSRNSGPSKNNYNFGGNNQRNGSRV